MSELKDVKVHLIDSLDEALKLRNWLGERREHHALGFDTETTGLIVGKDRVRLVQVGDAAHGWAIPFERWGGLFEDLVRVWDGKWIAHNAKYDVGMLGHEGIEMPRERVLDTMILHHVLSPHLSKALKNIAARLVDPSAAAPQTELDKAIGSRGAWTWATVPIDFQPYWTYGALDPVLTYKVFEKLWPQANDICPNAIELEHAVLWIIERMERYGAHIDTEFAAQKRDDFLRYVDESAKWCVDNYGVRPGSNAAIIRVLQEQGFEFSKATASGALALDKEVLGGIDHPLAQTVLQRRQLQKLASTYLAHFASDTDADSLIHPSINTLGARTGRMSMERPNLQNLPRKSEESPAATTIRNCVTAREGHKMLMCDFDQVEMRMLASLANVPAMIQAFKSDTDFFVSLARMIFDDQTIEKKDPRRQLTKGLGYATIYGAGVQKFATSAGVSLERAQWVRNQWNKAFPEVEQFSRTVTNTAVKRRNAEGVPYVWCPITHRRQVAEAGKEYALVNFLIQGAAAAVLKRKLVELDAAGLGSWMVVPVHDEIILDVPIDSVEEAARTLREVMNDSKTFSVPLTASVSWGDTWGTKEDYSPDPSI